jgi:tripartite-type tricarboxylate transporter receptor subunit TctC
MVNFGVRIALALLFALIQAPLAQAQTWPGKVVRIIVPYPPGTGPDIVARAVADRLSKNLNQGFIVENKAGANAIVGTGFVARGPADGYTLLIVDRLTLSVNPILHGPLPYDARKDLVSVSNLSDVNLYLVVNAALPVKTFSDFVDYAKANPGTLSFGSGGVGSIMHLNLEAIQVSTGISIVHVPYKGFGEALPNLVSGTVQVGTIGLESIQGLVRDGKLRLLAVGAPNRIPLTPDIPTITEAGGDSNMLLSTSFTMHARAGTPPDVLQEISAQVRRAMKDPELRGMLERRGQTPQGTDPKAVDALLESDLKQVEKIIAARKLKP